MAQTARMLSPTSLPAFSSGPTPAGSLPTRPVQRVRAIAPQAAQESARPSASLSAASPRGGEDGTTPNRILPRGSLLDLSV